MALQISSYEEPIKTGVFIALMKYYQTKPQLKRNTTKQYLATNTADEKKKKVTFVKICNRTQVSTIQIALD